MVEQWALIPPVEGSNPSASSITKGHSMPTYEYRCPKEHITVPSPRKMKHRNDPVTCDVPGCAQPAGLIVSVPAWRADHTTMRTLEDVCGDPSLPQRRRK